VAGPPSQTVIVETDHAPGVLSEVARVLAEHPANIVSIETLGPMDQGATLYLEIDRVEDLPRLLGRLEGLTVVRSTPTWDERTMPDALRRAHRVASGIWGLVRVEAGSLRFVAATRPMTDVVVIADEIHAIPPDIEHHVEPRDRCRFAIDFLTLTS